MNKAIIFKEWIKTRWCFLFISIISTGFTLYVILRINRIVTFMGAEHLWSILLSKDMVFVEQFAYLPLVCGMALAIAQLVPEMTQKRLKLTLHLPYDQHKMVLMMLAAGTTMLLILFALQNIILACYMQTMLPVELISRILLTSFPWFICGIGAYLFTSVICLEPTWRMRFINMIVFAGIARIHYLKDAPEAYNDFTALLILVDLSASLLTLRSVKRFKQGYQD